MTTAAIAGNGGNLTGPTGVTEITQWKAKISVDKLDASNMTTSGGWKEYIAGLIGMEGSCTCQGTAIPSRGIMAATLTTGGPSFTGSVFVDKVDVNVPVDGKVSYDVSFAFTGSITVA